MAPSRTYEDILQAMFKLGRFGIKLGLSTIRQILNNLNNPQEGFSCVHVAGTNGKGSIASALSTILNHSGYRVGLYTSPHLVRFNERIRINNTPISDDAVTTSYTAVEHAQGGTRQPTFFEYSTAMAFYEFGKQQVDWAIIETGMGGRLDATNIITPALSVISNISIEHKMYLGDTIEMITREKGGIIKTNRPVVTGVKQKAAIALLKEISGSKSAPFFRLGSDFHVRKSADGTFSYFGIENTWRGMQTALLGNYQIDNAALVLAACEVLNRNGVNISEQAMRSGLKQNIWPGRLEIVSTEPLVLLDGAHNFIAARNLAEFLWKNLSGRKITLVIGVLDDKPYKSMLRCLLPLCSRVIIVLPKIDRALLPEKLFHVAKGLVEDIEIIPDVGAALARALETASPEDAICIAGSLYVVGEAKAALEKIKKIFP
ncbi:MAG: folylpolyglutamate synthase/dihydrofolate synthase family protein [Desulfobacterales bacterium]|nr:folylpolyglutamate synthase/dihydrofolate synthase family protein [Desulfobacterales bacterium]